MEVHQSNYPVDITLSDQQTIPNGSGDSFVVGTLEASVSDTSNGSVLTYTVESSTLTSTGTYVIEKVNDKLSLLKMTYSGLYYKDEVDFEVRVKVVNTRSDFIQSISYEYTKDLTLVVTVNTAPTGLSYTTALTDNNTSVADIKQGDWSAESPLVFLNLSCVDPENDTCTFSLTSYSAQNGNAQPNLFEIVNGNQLQAIDTIKYTPFEGYVFQIKITDEGNNEFDVSVTIAIEECMKPTGTGVSATLINIPNSDLEEENKITLGTLTCIDPNYNPECSIKIQGFSDEEVTVTETCDEDWCPEESYAMTFLLVDNVLSYHGHANYRLKPTVDISLEVDDYCGFQYVLNSTLSLAVETNIEPTSITLDYFLTFQGLNNGASAINQTVGTLEVLPLDSLDTYDCRVINQTDTDNACWDFTLTRVTDSNISYKLTSVDDAFYALNTSKFIQVYCTDLVGYNITTNLTIPVWPNSKPDHIQIYAQANITNGASIATIGSFAVTDPDATDNHTIYLTDDDTTDNSLFSIVPTSLILQYYPNKDATSSSDEYSNNNVGSDSNDDDATDTITADYATKSEYKISVYAKDNASWESVIFNFTIYVQDPNAVTDTDIVDKKRESAMYVHASPQSIQDQLVTSAVITAVVTTGFLATYNAFHFVFNLMNE